MVLVGSTELVDATEAAALLGLRHRTSVATYAHRYLDFPLPVVDRGPRRAKYWSKPDLERWATERLRGGR